MFPDKYHLTREQNRRFAKTNLVRLVFTGLHFENINPPLYKVQTILDNAPVDDVSKKVINITQHLREAWLYLIYENRLLSLSIEENINFIVTSSHSLKKTEYVQELSFFNDLMAQDTSITDKAMTLMYHNMRNQLFWDGNKRTATLAANKLMIDNGAGLINVPLDKWDKWNDLISEFYLSGEMDKLKKWTYENGIQGVDFTKNTNLPKPDIKYDD